MTLETKDGTVVIIYIYAYRLMKLEKRARKKGNRSNMFALVNEQEFQYDKVNYKLISA